MRGLFVTATDTGVGKTVLSAALLAAMAAAGERVRAYKPAVTGLEDPAEIAARGQWPADHELLAAVSGMTPEQVAPLRYGPAVSPYLAAELAGEPIEPAQLLGGARAAARGPAGEGALVVEGVGGLLVPLAERYAVRDLALELGLPVVLAARPGLGTINHTLLTLEAARAVGLRVAAVVLTPWPPAPTRLEQSNHTTIARLGEVEVCTLPSIAGPEPTQLARAGQALPWRAWLDAGAEA
jgi:dethiobiotin synthetase